MKPFIPSWLDDAGLTAAQFRVLCHLWRSKGPRGCFPGADRIMRACRISENTVWKTLRDLEALGLIARKKFYRNSNSYDLIVPSVTAKETVTQEGESPQSERQHPPQSEGLQSPQTERCQSPQKRRCKGYPAKVPQLKVSSEGVADNTHTPSLRLVLTDAQIAELATKHRATPQGVTVALQDHNDIEAARYKKQATLETFRAYLLNDANAKETLRRHRPTAPTTAATQPEPHGWLIWLDDNRPEHTYADKSWQEIDATARAFIVAEMRKAGAMI